MQLNPTPGLESYHAYLDAISTVLIAIVGWIVSRIDRKFTSMETRIASLQERNQQLELQITVLRTKLGMEEG